MNNSKIILFSDKKECCGCGACLNICPKNAISMNEDEYGFKYPNIDKEKCILCGLCKEVCAFQNIVESNIPMDTYVAVAADEEKVMESASGGAFSAIAEKYLQNGGVVFGATFDDELNPIHIGITDLNLLYKLKGSKYVQSNIGNTYKKAKEFLKQGKKVLFSGTPCQIAGLKGFLRQDYDNLLTIDIICHGVPNERFFKDYLALMENRLGGKIIEFKFRDKNVSWEKNGSFKYEINKEIKNKRLYASESSYYHYFSTSDCFRESCYLCKYACQNRPGDITIGDYWGIEAAHSELLKAGEIKEEKGISVTIANSKKGNEVILNCNKLKIWNSEFNKARVKNGQLNKPSHKGVKHSEVMNTYLDGGYIAVDRLYNKEVGLSRYKNRLKAIIPMKIKRIIKQRRS